MPRNFAVKVLTCQNIDVVEPPGFQVEHAAAAVADKMVMRGGISVKAFRSDSRGKFLYFADFGQQRKIAVDGAETDVRKIFFDTGVDSLGGRMVVARKQKIFNRFSLSAIL